MQKNIRNIYLQNFQPLTAARLSPNIVTNGSCNECIRYFFDWKLSHVWVQYVLT